MFLDGNASATASMWSYRPPSSIHLRDSIENYLDMNLDTPDNMDSPISGPTSGYRHFLYTPDNQDSPLKAPSQGRKNSHRCRWRSGPFTRNRAISPDSCTSGYRHFRDIADRHFGGSTTSGNRYFSSTSDLQSLQEYHDILEQQLQHNSQDSMTFSTLSDLSLEGAGRSPRRLLRSNSDSLTGTGATGIPRDLSFPSGYESAESDRKDDWKQLFDSKRKVQNLLNDINDLCTETSDWCLNSENYVIWKYDVESNTI